MCEGVTAHIGQMFPEQVIRTDGIVSDRGTDYFDVMAFPVHLPVSGLRTRHSADGEEIDDSQFEIWIGRDGEPKSRSGTITVGRTLRLPVPRRRQQVCGDCPAVVFDCQPGDRRVGTAGRLWLTVRWLHAHQSELVA